MSVIFVVSVSSGYFYHILCSVLSLGCWRESVRFPAGLVSWSLIVAMRFWLRISFGWYCFNNLLIRLSTLVLSTVSILILKSHSGQEIVIRELHSKYVFSVLLDNYILTRCGLLLAPDKIRMLGDCRVFGYLMIWLGMIRLVVVNFPCWLFPVGSMLGWCVWLGW